MMLGTGSASLGEHRCLTSISLSVFWSGGGLRPQEADGGVGSGAVVGSDPGLRHRLTLKRSDQDDAAGKILNHQL